MKNHVVPPNSPETEMAIIGCVLVNKSALNHCIINIEADYFYDPQHKLIWKVIAALYSENKPIDEVIIKNWIDTNQLDKGNNFQVDYLIRLSSSFPVAYNIQEYCEILVENYQKRQIQDYFRDKYPEITKEGNWEDNLNEIQNKFYDLTNKFLIGDNSKIELKNVVKGLVESVESRGVLSGIKSGFNKLDRLTSGFQKSNVIIIAGTTSMGKTTFALNLCANMANDGKSIMYISMEMSYELLSFRLLSSESGVGSYQMKQHTKSMPRLEATDFANLYQTANKLQGWNLTIHAKGKPTVQNIRGLAKQKRHSKNGLDVIFIDYLQLLPNANTNYKQNRNEEVTTISREIKELAMELKIPIILLSQVNREAVKGVTPAPPVLSNLRDSGSIEQDADIVMFIHSEDYYDKGCKENDVWEMDIIIAKHRDGPIGNVKMNFKRSITRFYEDTEAITENENIPFGGI